MAVSPDFPSSYFSFFLVHPMSLEFNLLRKAFICISFITTMSTHHAGPEQSFLYGNLESLITKHPVTI